MKKLLLLFFLFPAIVQSQNWFPIGATWYYDYQEMLPFSAHGFTKYSVIKDTIIDIKLSKVIKKEVVRYNGDTLPVSYVIAMEDSGKVYYYNNNAFQLMYDFTLNVGDTLGIDISSSSCDSVSPLIVDSIKNLNISGVNLRVQYVKAIYYYGGAWQGLIDTITFPILERIGYHTFCAADNIKFFFNPVCSMGDEFILNVFRCYNDSNISYTGCYWTTHFPGTTCDTLIDESTGLTEISGNLNNIELFPNPASESIQYSINNSYKNCDISMLNFQGKIVFSKKNNCSENTISLAGIEPGIYFIRFDFGNRSIFEKLVIIK